ncbi:MAG: acyltransferase family protein [Clostridia bacterium]|nr:acyltransferase family protein [Clostridia bacterium]
MKDNNISKRESNIELLRILCIISIIVHHIVVHGIKPQLESTTLFPAGQMFNNFVFYKRLIFLDFGAAFGKIANNIFILISGYFLCEKIDFDLGKQLKKILSQVLFASVVLIIVSMVVGACTEKPYTNYISLSIFNNEWVFIGYYISIIVIGQLFLNKYLQNLDQKQYLGVVIALFAMISLTFSRSIVYSISANLVVVVTGLFLYCLGGYIKKYECFNKISTGTILIVILITVLLMILSYRNTTLNDINTCLINGVPEYHQTIRLYEEYSIVCIVIAVCTFELFKRIKIKNYSTVNSLASATFMVFLMHDNELARSIYRNVKWIEPYHENIVLFFAMLIGIVAVLYIVGVVAYFIYERLTKKRVDGI